MMKLGLLSSILEGYTLEEVIDFAAKHGFDCVELACWPKEKAKRRYAGVCHLDPEEMDKERIAYVNQYCRERNVFISSLAYYPNMLDPDLDKRNTYIEHLKKLIVVSKRLGINMVTTFIGKIQDKTVEENLAVYQEVWEPIVRFAEAQEVKIGIENCPMIFSDDEWPGGQNLACTPSIWKKMFALIPSDYLGLNYDPSHFIWQQMDYIKPIYEFQDKIFHVHLKDIKIYQDKLNHVGILAAPLEYMAPKIPGLGDINWGKFISALTDIGYQGCTCLEIEDRAFEHSMEDIQKSILLSKQFINNFI